ncbi:hypothetical protein G9P44_005354 [Scheffersomyces stipitis]|nr:hypothetical protein G9P44_005354 [Scheffersomyces stipitis]
MKPVSPNSRKGGWKKRLTTRKSDRTPRSSTNGNPNSLQSHLSQNFSNTSLSTLLVVTPPDTHRAVALASSSPSSSNKYNSLFLPPVTPTFSGSPKRSWSGPSGWNSADNTDQFDTPCTNPDSYFDGSFKFSSPASSSSKKSKFKGKKLFVDSYQLTSLDPKSPLVETAFPIPPSLSQGSSPITPTKGPKVKPFIFIKSQGTHTNKPSAADTLDRKCHICDEYLKSTLTNEKFVTLKCGDIIHGECFEVTVDYEIESAFSNQIVATSCSLSEIMEVVLPSCRGLKCITASNPSNLVPLDENLLEERVNSAVVAFNKKNVGRRSSNIVALNSTLSSPIPARTSRMTLRSTSLNPLKEDIEFRTPQYNIPRDTMSFFRASNGYSYETFSLLSMSPSPSPSNSTAHNSTIKMRLYSNLAIDTLKNHFIKYILENSRGFRLTSLLMFGSLRLADHLLVSYEGPEKSCFIKKIVYLFENYLAIWDLHSEPLLYSLTGSKVHITQPAIVRISGFDKGSPTSNVWFTSESNSVIEKWVIATSDLQFNFPVDFLTSTIILPTFSAPARVSTVDSVLSNNFAADTQKTFSQPISLPTKMTRSLSESLINSNTVAKSSEESIFTNMEIVNEEACNDTESDSDSDDEAIRGIIGKDKSHNTINGTPDSEQEDQYTSETDEDSDAELIYSIQMKTKPTCLDTWNDLLTQIDRALSFSHTE